MDPAWFLVLFAAWWALRTTIESTRIFLRNRKAPAHSRRMSRPKQGAGERLLVSDLLALLALFVFFDLGRWHVADLGISTTVPYTLSFAAGFVAYALYVGLWWLLFYMLSWLRFDARKIFGVDDVPKQATLAGLRVMWPRHRREKPLACVDLCVLNPVTEELIYRGVLVYGLGVLVGSHAAPVALGLALTLGGHAYQGPKELITHFVFYAVVVSLLFSPLGLVAAIGCHFGGDLIPVLRMKRQMKNWVRKRRAASLSRTVDPGTA